MALRETAPHGMDATEPVNSYMQTSLDDILDELRSNFDGVTTCLDNILEEANLIDATADKLESSAASLFNAGDEQERATPIQQVQHSLSAGEEMEVLANIGAQEKT